MTIAIANRTSSYNSSASPVTMGADAKVHVTYSGTPQKSGLNNSVPSVPVMVMYLRADSSAPFAVYKTLNKFGNFHVDLVSGSQYCFSLSLFAATDPASVTIATNT
jgi:hypothetical protein